MTAKGAGPRLAIARAAGKDGPGRASLSVGAVIGSYLLVSSSMLVVNKLAVRDLPFPNIILLMQVLSCSAFVAVAHALGLVELPTVRRRQVLGPFALYSLSFVAGLFANLKARGGLRGEEFPARPGPPRPPLRRPAPSAQLPSALNPTSKTTPRS